MKPRIHPVLFDFDGVLAHYRHEVRIAHLAAHAGCASERVREVLITGDFFVTPPRTVLDLEAALRGAPVDEIGERVRAFFAAAEIGVLSAGADDFAAVIEAAAADGK